MQKQTSAWSLSETVREGTSKAEDDPGVLIVTFSGAAQSEDVS